MAELRVASVAYWNAYVADGVARKLGGQVRAWNGLGVDARLFLLTPAPPVGATVQVDADVHRFGTPFDRVSALRGLVSAVRDFAPDLVYVRYDRFVPPLSAKRFRRPVIVELNTRRSELDARPWRVRAYDSLNRSVLLRSASGIVGVSQEILDDELPTRPRASSIVIANGVDPGEIPVLAAPANPSPRLCFVGSPQMRWHGLDKLVGLARIRPGWDFDIVGVTADQLGGDLPGNVVAHGFLDREAYLRVMAGADAAVGTLALHRKGMQEASPLKVPEYLLAGIPTIVAYTDTNYLDDDPWYLLRLPNTETNVTDSLAEIDAWVAGVAGRRVPRDEAEAHVGSPAKEEARVAFLRAVASWR